jgi:hypothetical protein
LTGGKTIIEQGVNDYAVPVRDTAAFCLNDGGEA